MPVLLGTPVDVATLRGDSDCRLRSVPPYRVSAVKARRERDAATRIPDSWGRALPINRGFVEFRR